MRRLTLASRLKERLIDAVGAANISDRTFGDGDEEDEQIELPDPPEESYAADKEYRLDVVRKRGVK